MNNYFKKALTISRVYLVDNIDFDNLRDLLVEDQILPPPLIETIDGCPNRRQKIREMLECIPRRADPVFPTFLVSLYKSNQPHIAMKLYETTMNLIVDPIDFPVRGWLDNSIRMIMSPPTSTGSNQISYNANPSEALEMEQQQPKDPVENSLPFSPTQESTKPMESENSDTFMENKLESASSNNNPNYKPFLSFALSAGDTNLSSSLKSKSQVEHSISSSFSSSHSSSSFSSSSSPHDSVYLMDSTPRGLFCMIMPDELQSEQLSGDAVPAIVQNPCNKVKEEPIFTSRNARGIDKCDNELQTLFWDFGFYSCLMKLEDSTLHPDKLNDIILKFSQFSPHAKSNCCALALLGFSVHDLHLTKIFSWFDNQNCPFLAGKPKLFLIQVPDEITPSNLMSGVEIPEDTVVAVTAEKKSDRLQPGLVSSVVQVCQQMGRSSYSFEDIFIQVQHDYPKLKIAVKNTLKKSWMVESVSM